MAYGDTTQARSGKAGDRLRLSVHLIDGYDRNHRLTANPKRAEIKASLRATGGCEDVLRVTQRPGAQRYVLLAGRNTTLEVLKELYQETGEERFGSVPVQVEAWPGELALLEAHERENAVRGEASWAEIAVAVMSEYALWPQRAEKAGSKGTDAAFLADRHARTGRRLDKADFSRMRFFVTGVLPHIPFVARHLRIGRRDVRRIQSAYARASASGAVPAGDAAISKTDSEADPDMPSALGQALRTYDEEVAQARAGAGQHEVLGDRLDVGRIEKLLCGEASQDTPGALKLAEDGDYSRLSTSMLYHHAHAVALSIAKRHRFEALVKAFNHHYGFYLTDLCSGFCQDDHLGRPAAAWYLLYEICGMGTLSERILSKLLDPDSNLAMIYEVYDLDELKPHALWLHSDGTRGYSKPPFMTCFRALDRRDQDKVCDLMQITGELRRRG